MKAWRAFCLLFAAFFIISMITAVVSAEGTSPRIISDWEKEHTILVDHITDYYYEDDVLYVKETYSGLELKNKFKTDALANTITYKLDQESAKKLGIVEGQRYSNFERTFEVFTSENDPPNLLRDYDYPQWIFEKVDGVYHQLTEPVNIAWESNNLNTVKSEMTEEGWWDIIAEDVYYIYDNGWKAGDGVASDPVRLFGGWHVRLWQMADGDVVGAVHHDSSVPHHADGFENAEEYLAAFYDELDDTQWHVYEDNYALNNYVASPYSNGMCTQIYYW